MTRRVEDSPKGEPLSYDLKVTFGRNVWSARKKTGLSQAEMAKRTGLPQQYISQIEAGKANVTLETVALLARVVDHEVTQLFEALADRLKK